MSKISSVSDFSLEYIVRINDQYMKSKAMNEEIIKLGLTLKDILNYFNYKELIDTNYINISNFLHESSILKDILAYLRVSSIKSLYNLDNDGTLFKARDGKTGSKLLWLEKCFRETHSQELGIYSKENINYLVQFIHVLSQDVIYDENRLIYEFNNNGIFLVFQNDLPGSGIRGAFKVERDKPAIYVTRKHKRPADIYFAILHELAHCKSDFNSAKKSAIISSEHDPINDLENRADSQAYDWMVDDKTYDKINFKFELNELENIINKFDGNKMFLIYRLAKDHNDIYKTSIYQKLNKVLEI